MIFKWYLLGKYQTFFFENCITIVNCELKGSLKASIVYHLIVSGMIPLTTYSQVQNRRVGVAIGGGGMVGKILKVNKQRVLQ